MKSTILFLVSVTILSCSHRSNPQKNCDRLLLCLEKASALTGKNYLYDDMNLKETVGSVGKINWTKENADILIGELLASAGYYRLDMGNDIYKLINAIDVRYISGVKSFSATRESNDPLPSPNSADPVELVYHSKNGLERPSEIARNLRPFMSRYGRVIDERSGGLIIIRDTASAIPQLLSLIRKMDTPVTPEEKKSREQFYRMEELRERTRQEMIKKVQEMMEKNKKENSPAAKP